MPIAGAQVATRLQLDWLGQVPTSTSLATVAFSRVFTLVVSFWVTRVLLFIIIALLDPNIDSEHWVEPSSAYYFFCAVDDLLALVYFGFAVVLLRNLRMHVRSKYAIPEANQCPTGCEDTCCSLFCSCFVAAQMLRHTADYDHYGGRCCTRNGLPSNAPATV